MSRDDAGALSFESTGNTAFDEILGGGIPARSIVVLAGEPGSGKTLLTLQMLFAAARRGKKSLYLTTLSEPAVKIIRYMQAFDFFDVELLDEMVLFSDLGSAVRQGAERTLSEIEAKIEEHEPAFVVIDSFRAMNELIGANENLRPFIYDLAVQMAGWGATALLIGEYERSEFSRFPEFAIADGIIRLGSERQELTSVRALEVLKLRGAGYASGQHFFDIDRRGVSIYPRVRAPDDAQRQPSPDTSDRVETGIQGLDELLAGGLPRGSSTMVQGGTGVGKTLLGLQFLVEGAKRSEKGMLFTMEETPAQLRGIARNLGWDLEALERDGMLGIRYTSPVELSTDRFLYEARNEVRDRGASRAVFDSLTTMALGVPSDRRFKELVYALAKHMRGMGVSLMMTIESEQLLGTATLSGQGVSFVADNLVQLRYVELGGRLERALTVLKARGVQHESELRSMVIGKHGLSVERGRFKDLHGVLTGLPTRSEEVAR